MRLALAAALGLLLFGAAQADPHAAAPAAKPSAIVAGRTVIVGPTGQSVVVTPQLLAGLDRAKATMIDHGGPHVYEGVRLTQLLRMVGAPTGAMIHGPADRDYLVVTGSDGFRSVFSLAETDASVQPHAVILADRMDGAPLSARDAPYRIVVDGDLKPARSVYAVTRIEVKSLH
jgi:DMSO/TMAO reductase YedYZ molybdopterin-dependent catalytic subunit